MFNIANVFINLVFTIVLIFLCVILLPIILITRIFVTLTLCMGWIIKDFINGTIKMVIEVFKNIWGA